MTLKNRICLILPIALLFCTINPKIAQQPTITKQEEVDLSLFQSEDNKSVFDAIDKTITKIGSDSLQQLVKAPIADIQVLEKRQETIKFWLDNPALTDSIKAELHTFAKHEEMIEILWGPQDQICKTTLQDLYFDNSYLNLKYLNSSPHYLNLLQVVNVGNMFSPLIEHMVIHFFLSKTLGEMFHLTCNHSHHHDDHQHSHANHNHDHHHGHHHHDSGTLKKFLYNAYNAAHFAFHIYGLKQLYDAIKQKAAIAKALQSNLIAASRCLKSLKTIHALLKNSTSLELTHFEQLNSFFESPESQSLIDLLEKNTFQGSPSMLSNIGNILAAQTVIKENAHFREAIEALGDLDASISIATLYQDHQNTNTAYSFANYATSNTPYINAQKYWNPLIGINQSTNNFAIGLHQPRIAIITGSNNAGKSTNLKSMALIALLAQTFTIVPAQYVELTPFIKIGTFIHHSDSPGSSLFTTELIKANILVDFLQNQQGSSEFSLIIFDELFKSTSPEKGQEKAYSLIRYLGNFQNCLCMVSTHYPKLTILETENASLFKNYTAQAVPDSQGTLSYSLQEGSSLPSQSFDVLQAQGIQSIWES